MPTWNLANAQHLLARCLFGFSRKDVELALSMSLNDFVDKHLLADKAFPPPPDTWVDELPKPDNAAVNGQRTILASNWWFGQMLNEGVSMREKMVLFWHNHFVSQIEAVNFPQYMYIQNQLFRQYAFGNMLKFTKAVNIDPAMLIYLDGRDNQKTKPNENYGRELLELFTIGIGNYTQKDIEEAAKALTGWQVNGLKSVFNNNRFNTEEKVFFGKKGNFNADQIVDIIFEQAETARFICRKLYKEFVFYKTDEVFVEEMAKVFRNSKYEIKPVLAFLFKSDHFYQSQFRGGKIKTPTEFIVGTLKNFDLKQNIDFEYISKASQTLQQFLFNPPDVKGWRGQRDWISSTTYPTRNVLTDSIITGKQVNGRALSFKVDILPYARSFKTSEKAAEFVKEVSEHFCLFELSEKRKNDLLETLLSGTVITNWSTQAAMANTRLEAFFKALLRLPEYQLC